MVVWLQHHNVCPVSSQKWSRDDRQLVTKMGKMAFKMLERNISVFFEGDVVECGLELAEVTVYSGICTELPTAASDGRRMFCFIHFTFQVKLFSSPSLTLEGYLLKRGVCLCAHKLNTRRFKHNFGRHVLFAYSFETSTHHSHWECSYFT